MTNYYSNNDRGFSLLMVVENVGTPDVTKNTSDVRARLYLRNTSITFSGYTISGTMTMHTSNFSYSASPSMLSQNSSILLLDKTLTVTHNDDGSKFIAIAANINGQGGYSPNALNIPSVGFDLPKIARASTVTVNDLDIGSTMTINITRASNNFTHTVRYNWNGKTGTIGTGIGTQTTWTVPMEFCNDVPNSDYFWGTIYVDTYDGSNFIGTSTDVFNGYVPKSVVPKLTGITLTDTNSKSSSIVGSSKFVQIISNPSVTFNGATGAYGSTIKGFYAEIVGKNQSVNENGKTFGIMNWNGSATVRATVTDSRGRTSEPFETTIDVLAYSGVALDFSAQRGGVDANQIVVTVNAMISPLIVNNLQKNRMTLQFKTAPHDTQTFTLDTSDASKTYTDKYQLINQSFILSGTFASDKSFDVYATLTDSFSSYAEKMLSVIANFTAVAIADGGTVATSGIGIGKEWEHGSIDSAGDVYTLGKFLKDGKEIQHYQMTDNTGKITRLDSVDLNTIINDTKPIAVYATANMPISGHGYYYLEVFQHASGNAYVLQRVTTRAYAGGLRTFERIREAGAWGAWVELMTVNSPQMINTGWVSTGVSGVYYKRTGDVVAVKMEINTTANQAFDLGSIPVSYIPLATGAMYRLQAWSLDQTVGRNLQISADGSMSLLSTNRGDLYRTQITWTI